MTDAPSKMQPSQASSSPPTTKRRQVKDKGKGTASSSATFRYGSIVDGLKAIYRQTILPVEQASRYGDFYTPSYKDVDIDAKPIVLLLGQYSTGKTSFIRHLLGNLYQGAMIGPEPTTDRFVAVMGAEEDRVIPGSTAVIQADKPFHGLSQFGSSFLNKFQISLSTSAVLKSMSLIDTPGVLSGEKQRHGRNYDFVKVVEYFASKSDCIVLFFDSHKLDISDELKLCIDALRGHDDKIRIVLNKADGISAQQLLRVYGALMWSLGKVIRNPEVVRVYLGSWGQPLKTTEVRSLIESEMLDLATEFERIPRNAAVRKINEIVKRSRSVRLHALIIKHLRKEMPPLFFKESTQVKLMAKLPEIFEKLQLECRVPATDFPNVEQFRERMKFFDLSKFDKIPTKTLEALDRALAVDIPQLMDQFPELQSTHESTIISTQLMRPPPQTESDSSTPTAWVMQPVASRESEQVAVSSGRLATDVGASSSTPPQYTALFSEHITESTPNFTAETMSNDRLQQRQHPSPDQAFPTSSGPMTTAQMNETNANKPWLEYPKYTSQFRSLLIFSSNAAEGKLLGEDVKSSMLQSGLPPSQLASVWTQADWDRDGKLDLEQFCYAMWLCDHPNSQGK